MTELSLQWQELELASRGLVTDYLRRDPPQISEHTFTNLFVWREHRPICFAETDGTLLIAARRGETLKLLGPPRGETPLAELTEALSGAGVRAYRRLPTAAAEHLEEVGFCVEKDRDNSDYVYRQEDLSELPGRRYHRQQNLVNRCLSRYECDYCEITPGMLEEVARMQDRWCSEKDCGEDPGLRAEWRAIRQTIEHYGELDLLGGVVRIDGEVQAYSIGEALAPDTAVVHFEKAMERYDGLYQVINKWFAERALGDFEFVNREQDLGIPGLRKAKKSYHPDHMVEKFSAARDPALVAPAEPAAEGRCQE